MFDRMPGVILRYHRFVKLFAWTNAGELNLGIGSERLHQLCDRHARDLWDENLAATHCRQRLKHKVHSLFQRNPEAGHPRVGDVDDAVAALLEKDRYNAAAAPDHVA